MIGARDMAFPLLNTLSFWTWVMSGLMVLSSFMVPYGTAAAGWTTYPPLSGNAGTPGWGQSLFVLAIFTTGTATIMGGVNYVTTVIRLRAPGMTWGRLPLTVWGQFLTAILNVLFVPVLAGGGILLLLDRWFGTSFYVAGALAGEGAGDPILFQHLFWIFGHPEVYILILPAWGFVGDFVSFFSRKPAYWYKGSVLAMTAVSVMSAVVYGHHMYTTGMAPLLGKSFMMLTLIISVPAELLFLNWLHTIYHGSMRKTVPMLFALGTIFVFGSGGLTGLPLATITTDLYLHATMFVVGHFHLTMASAAFLATFGSMAFLVLVHWPERCLYRTTHLGLCWTASSALRSIPVRVHRTPAGNQSGDQLLCILPCVRPDLLRDQLVHSRVQEEPGVRAEPMASGNVGMECSEPYTGVQLPPNPHRDLWAA